MTGGLKQASRKKVTEGEELKAGKVMMMLGQLRVLICRLGLRTKGQPVRQGQGSILMTRCR